MPDPQTPNKFLYTPAHNADIDTWDVPVNANWNGIDRALGTYTNINTTGLGGNIPLTTSQAIPLGFVFSGTPTSSVVYQTPAGVGGLWLVRNQATLGTSITLGFASASGGPTVTLNAGSNTLVSTDGTANGMIAFSGQPGGSDTNVQYNKAGAFAGKSTFTFNDSTNTLTFPNIGAGSPLTGMAFWFAGVLANIPANTLLCDGSAVNRTTYSALFAKIGTTWGAGDGVNTFNLPDLRGRVLAGVDGGAGRLGGGTSGGITGTASLGATGGEQSHTLIIAEMPAHTHPVNAVVNGGNFNQGGGGLPNYDTAGNTSSTGGGGAHNTVQPTAVGYWVIFT